MCRSQLSLTSMPGTRRSSFDGHGGSPRRAVGRLRPRSDGGAPVIRPVGLGMRHDPILAGHVELLLRARLKPLRPRARCRRATADISRTSGPGVRDDQPNMDADHSATLRILTLDGARTRPLSLSVVAGAAVAMAIVIVGRRGGSNPSKDRVCSHSTGAASNQERDGKQ